MPSEHGSNAPFRPRSLRLQCRGLLHVQSRRARGVSRTIGTFRPAPAGRVGGLAAGVTLLGPEPLMPLCGAGVTGNCEWRSSRQRSRTRSRQLRLSCERRHVRRASSARQPLNRGTLEPVAVDMGQVQNCLLLEYGPSVVAAELQRHWQDPTPADRSCPERGPLAGLSLLDGNHQRAEVRSFRGGRPACCAGDRVN